MKKHSLESNSDDEVSAESPSETNPSAPRREGGRQRKEAKYTYDDDDDLSDISDEPKPKKRRGKKVSDEEFDFDDD